MVILCLPKKTLHFSVEAGWLAAIREIAAEEQASRSKNRDGSAQRASGDHNMDHTFFEEII